MVVVLADADPLKKYMVEMAKVKRMILDGVKDHVVCHIASRGTAKEMWDALSTLYQGSFEQRKTYLEQKMRSIQMQKGERIDPFLTKLQETRDELAVVGSTPQGFKMVRLALIMFLKIGESLSRVSLTGRPCQIGMRCGRLLSKRS